MGLNSSRLMPDLDHRRTPSLPGYINGRLIDTIRRNRRLTVAQFGLTCGIPSKTMKRICAGKNPPTGPHLLKILILGGVVPELLEIDGWERRA